MGRACHMGCVGVVGEGGVNVRCEVCATGRRSRSIRRKLAAPNCAFVSDEGPNPVPGPLSEHGIPIFTA